MENQYKYRSLIVFAFVLAAYGIHAGTSHILSEKAELPDLTVEEVIVEAPASEEAVEAAIEAEENKSQSVAVANHTKNVNPAEELFARFGNNTPVTGPRFIEHMGVKIDLSEIDLLVETEIAAGTIKSRKDIHSFRLKAIDRKADQIRESLAQQYRRGRVPTSTR
jgi:hypothetical protein